MKFVLLTEYLGGLQGKPDPSELHGIVTGWMCAGSTWPDSHKSTVLEDWLEGEILTKELDDLILELVGTTFEGLKDIELGFHLMIPAENVEINLRRRAISQWCAGFLAGFGMTGRFQETELKDEIAEVLRDLARIASQDEEIPDDEENEVDLVEIVEYVRMSALLVFTECADKVIH